MPTFTNKKSLYYNDVNLLGRPAPHHIKSRSQVPQEKWRIIVSPMHALIGPKFIVEAAKNGISVFLHRFNSLEWQKEMYDLFYANFTGENFCCVATGLKNFEKNIQFFYNNGIKNCGIEIANGYLDLTEYHDSILAFLWGKQKFDKFYVGNVNTQDGVFRLEKFKDICEELIIRVGVGGGSPCSSSDVAAINRGNVTEIIECSEVCSDRVMIAADGGISKSGFGAKAFAAGADYIMMGGYFSKAEEAETNVNGSGEYWGGASERQLQILGQSKHSEGKILPPNKELFPLKKLVDDFWGGLASYVTYSGYDSLEKAISNGLFEIKQNSLPPRRV